MAMVMETELDVQQDFLGSCYHVVNNANKWNMELPLGHQHQLSRT